MSYFTPFFIAFLLVGVIVYYLMPAKYQWLVLLAMNIVFYCSGGWRTIGFMIVTIVTVYAAARAMAAEQERFKSVSKANKEVWSRDEKKLHKARSQSKQRWILIACLVINVGILCVLKYVPYILERALYGTAEVPASTQAGGLVPALTTSLLGLALPLGISFYTFSAIAYLLDVRAEKQSVEKNPLRLALFLSFFPHIVQGPIARYGQLGPEVEAAHPFEEKHVARGAVLILYGFFKKLVIANRSIMVVNAIFDGKNYTNYDGIYLVFAVLMYSVWQYADFSGGIDIATGAGELFGIELAPNFRRPYFSASLGEFWRRWHISLGAWMRDYIFYPFALTKPMQRFGKWCGKHLGKHFGRVLPACIANLLVFIIVGVWHGPQLHYLAWGLYNGVVIALSDVIEPLRVSIARKLRLDKIPRITHVIAVLWTFFIVNIGWFFDRSEGVKRACKMIVKSLTRSHFSAWNAETVLGWGLTLQDYWVLGVAVVFLLIVSILQEILEKRGETLRDRVLALPIVPRWAILYTFFFLVVIYALSRGGLNGFAYAQF